MAEYGEAIFAELDAPRTMVVPFLRYRHQAARCRVHALSRCVIRKGPSVPVREVTFGRGVSAILLRSDGSIAIPWTPSREGHVRMWGWYEEVTDG